MDLPTCLSRTVLSIEGSRVIWRDSSGLTLRSFGHRLPPLDAVFCSFHKELTLCILVSPHTLTLHDIHQGGAQDISLKSAVEHIHCIDQHQMILCMSPSTMYSITYPSLQPYPLAIDINPNHPSPTFEVVATTRDVLCTLQDAYLSIWKVIPYQVHLEVDRRVSLASNRSSMSPHTESTS